MTRKSQLILFYFLVLVTLGSGIFYWIRQNTGPGEKVTESPDSQIVEYSY